MKIYLLVLSFFIYWASIAQELKTKQATVFRNGVQLKQGVSISIPAGNQELTVWGLANELDVNSVTIKGNNNQLQLLGYRVEQNFLEPEKLNPQIQQLTDSANVLQNLIGKEKRNQEAIRLEREMMVDNKRLLSDNKANSELQLEKFATFYRKKMEQLIQAGFESAEKQKSFELSLQRIQNQINVLRSGSSSYRNELILLVDAKTAITFQLEVQYFSPTANWQSTYELRAKDGNNQLDLVHKAQVFQNTGLNWKQVKLTLSSGNPSRNKQIPPFQVWQLQFLQPIARAKFSQGAPTKAREVEAIAAEAAGVNQQAFMDSDGDGVQDFFTEETATAQTYETTTPFDLTSQEQRVIKIEQHQLPVSFRYFSFPAKQEDAFMQAMVTQYETLGLSPGEMALFLDDNFVGNSYFQPQTATDTLEISFGIDDKIAIKYESIKEKSARKLIGSNISREFEKQITIKNNRKTAIDLLVIDQIPVSTDKDIEVKADIPQANLEDNTGKLSYQLNLKSNETKQLKFGFKIKYPKNKVIKGL